MGAAADSLAMQERSACNQPSCVTSDRGRAMHCTVLPIAILSVQPVCCASIRMRHPKALTCAAVAGTGGRRQQGGCPPAAAEQAAPLPGI